MNAVRSTRKMYAATLGIAAMALCFAWGAWAQDPADPVDVDDPADTTGLVDVDDPADSTGLVDVDDPADTTGLVDVDDPADSTGLVDVDDPPDTGVTPVIAITAQPAAVTAVMQGSIADTLKIGAGVTGGATLSYQWYEKIKTSDDADDADDAGAIDSLIMPYEDWESIAIDGATSASFAIPADLDTGTYVYYCVVSATNGAASVQSAIAVVTVELPTSVASAERSVPSLEPGKVAVISPATALSAGFTAGPNPVAKQSGGVNFFWTGKAIGNATLYVYDASGNFVRKIGLSDNAAGGSGKRVVGVWDLRDSKGRSAPEGSYVVKGAVLTKDGKKEKVSLILGVK